MRAIQTIRRFWKEESGVAAIEFGLTISILIVILMGCFEAGRYILLNQKLDRTSTSVVDLIAQADNVTAGVLSDTYAAADEQTRPFDLAGHGRVVVSSVYKPDTSSAKVQWQCAGGGSYTSAASSIGSEGGDAAMPTTFSVDVGENIVVAEVFYDYEPFLFEGLFQPAIIRHTSFMRPRGSLLVTDPGC
jgi:Flp pilus assembly protein TadG